MRLLLDECVPRKMKFLFTASGHECETVREAGFDGRTNGELLALADPLFDALITIDRNIRYQQNLTGRNIAILVLCARSNDISDIAPLVPQCLVALGTLKPGQVIEVTLP
jgi:predicted nuclease of predicted toxin-antitoxin system